MPYRLEYASSNRASCKGQRPCSGTKILKGELRLGTLVEIQGSQSFQWRHWGCVTPRIIRNIQEKDGITDPADLDGFEDLIPEDQARVTRAFAEGHVAAEDIPETALKGQDAEDAKAVEQQAAAAAPASTPAAQPPAKKRGRPSKASLEATAAAADAAAPSPSQSAPAPFALNGVNASSAVQSPQEKTKRGRPPKNAAAAPLTPATPQPAAPAASQVKKRGRPPKARSDATQPVQPVPFPDAAHVGPAAPAPAPAAAAPATPVPARKRGRPSKDSIAAAAAAAAAASPVTAPARNDPVASPGVPLAAFQSPLAAPSGAAASSPKKRGRPKKDASIAQASPSVAAPYTPPQPAYVAPAKKRGRPKKEVDSDSAAANSASLSQVTTPPLPRTPGGMPTASQAWPAAPNSGKKRGRPPKEKVEGDEPVKRPRGRPKKSDAAVDAAVAADVPAPAAPAPEAAAIPAKKPRGRPKKER
ncbi:uncharacterized protein SPSC_03518 [Sporisorium scitamineum]|uniref:PARP-type domain-containing protein n=1 Tax=Sporisorium scitamineum TaxID=49012 RepID=A0A0F7RUD3_9BASI|nr:uncharacterized protein SPSC_03518 [Sporisorium scitamineum]CDR98908.1 hypothetical protein [Sporisorium scitamineum]